MSDLEKQTLRHVLLAILAARHPAALTIQQLLRRIAMEVDFLVTPEHVLSAAEFLRSLEHLEQIPDPYGVAQYYRATAAGVLSHERSH